LLHQKVGPDYRDRIVIPEVVAAVRSVMSAYRPQQLFAVRSEEMQSAIIERAAKEARARYVSIDDVLIREIRLPAAVQTAIQVKLQQEQQAEEYKYRLIRENQEKTRKQIEAEGIAIFQDTVNKTVTESLLRWKGIEATENLARSPNTKIIIVGGRDGLPVILDTSTTGGDAGRGAAPQTPSGAGPGGRGQPPGVR
jgi:prohibitin 2